MRGRARLPPREWNVAIVVTARWSWKGWAPLRGQRIVIVSAISRSRAANRPMQWSLSRAPAASTGHPRAPAATGGQVRRPGGAERAGPGHEGEQLRYALDASRHELTRVGVREVADVEVAPALELPLPLRCDPADG